MKQNGSEIVLCFNGKMLQDALSWRSRLGWPVCMVIGVSKGEKIRDSFEQVYPYGIPFISIYWVSYILNV